MDVLKPRTESKELLVWRSLHARSELTSMKNITIVPLKRAMKES